MHEGAGRILLTHFPSLLAGGDRSLPKEVDVPILVAVVSRELVGFRLGGAYDLLIARKYAWWRMLRPLAASPSSKGAARRCEDALVAIVPADPIARRGIASEYLLNDTRAGLAIG